MACARHIGTQRLEPDFWVLGCLFPCATLNPVPGLASGSWIQWSQGSFALHFSLLSASIQYISGSQSETTLLNKPLIIMPRTINTFQIPDASLCLPASLEVTLGYASGSGQCTVIVEAPGRWESAAEPHGCGACLRETRRAQLGRREPALPALPVPWSPTRAPRAPAGRGPRWGAVRPEPAP